MIVEDDESVADLIAFKFETQGYATRAFDNGADALAHLEDAEALPSAIVLDLVMPGLDGMAVLERIADSTRLSAIPVIVLTGRQDDDVVTRAFELGADDYVTKPFSPAALATRVTRFC